MKPNRKPGIEQPDAQSRRANMPVVEQADLRSGDAAKPQLRIKKHFENRKIRSLRPHPRQSLFPELPDADLRRLAESMEKDGLIEPIEILPNGTIISGHQRVRAAKLLGWTKIRCWVRYDLAKQDEAAVERRLIEANFNRRQLGPLEKARCYLRLRELERSKPGRSREVKGDLRDYLAKQFGLSGRNLERWVKLLNAPLEIQRAVIEKKLTLVTGAKVAGLPKGIQEEIAAAIRDGIVPKQAVATHTTPKDNQPAPKTAYHRLYRALEQAFTAMGTRAKEVDLRFHDSHLPTLRKGNRLIRNLIAKIQSATEQD